MSRILITGASGLVGSACVERFLAGGWEVVGVDNNLRKLFFGPDGDTDRVAAGLMASRDFECLSFDIRNENRVEWVLADRKPDAIVHCAGQPSHDWAASNPLIDFDVNARGTLVLLEAARKHCPAAPFVFTSTNKVYGDGPNLFVRTGATKVDATSLGDAATLLVPGKAYGSSTRYEFGYEPYNTHGISEDFTLDQSMHSLFGCSKLAADQYVQEYGRLFGMQTACLRCGCLTGAGHAAVSQHGFLSYLVKCALTGELYTVHGYRGRQVRDNLAASDVAEFVWQFVATPRKGGAVYNIGGGKANSVSILEAIRLIEDLTDKAINSRLSNTPRKGDHVVYYSDLRRAQADYPAWRVTKDIPAILRELAVDWRERLGGAP